MRRIPGRIVPGRSGANDRVGLGLIGFGLIGKRHLLDFKDQTDADIVAIAEAHSGRLDEALAASGGSARGFGDFRALIDHRDIDAVADAGPLRRPDDHDGAPPPARMCTSRNRCLPMKARWPAEIRRHNRVVRVGTPQALGPTLPAPAS